jgi:hypothetical protein
VSASRRATVAVVVAWCLLGVGDAIHAGYYSSVGLACILAGFVAVVTVAWSGSVPAIPDRGLLVLPAAVCLVAAVVNPTRRYLYLTGADLRVIEALAIATAVAALLCAVVPRRWESVAWVGVVALATATGIVTIVLINDPGIDVWDILQQSSTGLLHGDDMYRQHWAHSTGLQAVYPYLPVSTVLLAPFRWLFGDVRYGLLAASVLGAWLLRRFGTSRTPALAALALVFPGWVLLINRSWTEPILVTALAAAILALRSGRTVIVVLTLALALACKQHVVLLLPIFAVWPSFGLRRTLVACGVALAAVLPWVIAGPRAFWHDAVHANLDLGVRTQALDVPAVFARHGVTLGLGFTLVVLVLAYALVFWRVPRTTSGLAIGCAVVMWAFDLANKQTFFNHYTLPLGLLLVALAVADPSPLERDDPVTTGSLVSRSLRQRSRVAE